MSLIKQKKKKKKQKTKETLEDIHIGAYHCKTIHKFLKLLNLKELNLDWSLWILHNCLKKKKLLTKLP